MKKTLLPILLVSVFVVPFISGNALATWYPPHDWETAFNVAGFEATATLTWEFESCEWVCVRTDADIYYRSTSPPSARPGSIDEGSLVVTTTWTIGEGEEPGPHAMGNCHAEAEFWSEINPAAKRGVNHGDIDLFWTDDDGTRYDMFSWSFNVKHLN